MVYTLPPAQAKLQVPPRELIFWAGVVCPGFRGITSSRNVEGKKALFLTPPRFVGFPERK